MPAAWSVSPAPQAPAPGGEQRRRAPSASDAGERETVEHAHVSVRSRRRRSPRRRGRRAAPGPPRVRGEDRLRQLEQLERARILDAVVDARPLAPALDEPLLAQRGEMLRGAARVELEAACSSPTVRSPSRSSCSSRIRTGCPRTRKNSALRAKIGGWPSRGLIAERILEDSRYGGWDAAYAPPVSRPAVRPVPLEQTRALRQAVLRPYLTVEDLADHEPPGAVAFGAFEGDDLSPSAWSGRRASRARGGCAGWRRRRTRAAAAPARRCSARSCATRPRTARRAYGATPASAPSRCTSEPACASSPTCSSHPTSVPTSAWSSPSSRASAPRCSRGSRGSSATTRRRTSPPPATATSTRCAAASRRCSTSWRWSSAARRASSASSATCASRPTRRPTRPAPTASSTAPRCRAPASTPSSP